MSDSVAILLTIDGRNRSGAMAIFPTHGPPFGNLERPQNENQCELASLFDTYLPNRHLRLCLDEIEPIQKGRI